MYVSYILKGTKEAIGFEGILTEMSMHDYSELRDGLTAIGLDPDTCTALYVGLPGTINSMSYHRFVRTPYFGEKTNPLATAKSVFDYYLNPDT